MVWLPKGEKKSEDTYKCFDRIPACDRQTDRQTDGRTSRDGISALCIASRGITAVVVEASLLCPT